MKTYASSACLFLLLLTGCFAWQENVELHGVKFEKARVESDGFVIGRIGSDMIIGERPCRKGWIHLHPNGILAGFTASRDMVLARFTIPAGTWVLQDSQGAVKVCAFPHDVEIQGHACQGGFGGAEGVQTAFYPGGALKEFYCREPVRIDGIPCKSSPFKGGIILYENGRLQSAILTEDFIIDGRNCREGDRIRLTPAGHAAGN
jgi:hypothetical protein